MAIVYDAIIAKGGAERVLMYFFQAFPKAKYYSLVYLKNNTYPEFQSHEIHTSWLNNIIKSEKQFKQLFFPVGIFAASQMDLTDYDVVIQLTTHCAKYVKTKPDALLITYCFTPFRLVWNSESYRQYLDAFYSKRLLMNGIISLMRSYDYKKAQKSTIYWAMTDETANRIKKAYNKTVTKVLNPPIDCSKFYASKIKKDYFLMVSRLEEYKKVELVINVFNDNGKELIIVGNGSQKSYLRSIAKNNIIFHENVDDFLLRRFYSEAKGLIFPQHEDYGLTPLEANASGCPVIAYSKGGVLETMVPHTGDDQKCTALFFEEQTENSLLECIKKFEMLTFDPHFIRKHAERFDIPIFINEIQTIVDTEIKIFYGNSI